MRSVLYGLIVGFMLSALRAPLGLDLVQIPGVEAGTAYGYRSLALVVIAAAWWLKREGSVSIGFLASTALAFALHALWLSSGWVPASAPQLWITALLGFAALVWLGRGDMRRDAPVVADALEAADEPSFVQMIGLCAAGAGVAVALESVARHVRLLGSGLAQDDAVSASVLLASMAFGAIACGWLVRSRYLRRVSFPAGLAATATACFAALSVLDSFATTRGLGRFLQPYGLDASSHGMLGYDALIAAACFFLPAVVLGATLRGARSKLELTSLLLGAALGLHFVPRLLERQAAGKVGDIEFFSAQLAPLGCLTAIGGAALALLATASLGARARWSALAFTLLLCGAPLGIVVGPKLIVSPWLAVPPKQYLVFDSPEGLVTVEPSEGGLAIATLDRLGLTPPTGAAAADMGRIKLSLAMVPDERWVARDSSRNGEPALRVLLIGQHSPLRARAFQDAGVERVDRTAAWFGSMKRIDDSLFENQPPPLGERLPPAEASRRIAAGEYDLVVVLPVQGDAPLTQHLSVPEQTTLVAWFSPEQWIVQRNLGGAVLYWSEGLDDPCVGVVVHGAQSPLVDGEPPLFVAAGEPTCVPPPIARLGMHDSARFEERTNWCRAALARRLADAARGGQHEKLMEGFASFYAGQSRSAEFETKDERTELSDEVLVLFRESALAGPPTALVRTLWEHLALTLLGKRDVEGIYTHLGPLAAKYPPWPVLEQVLAQADLESLEPEAAARRLSAVIAARARTNDGAESVTGRGTKTNDATTRLKDLELWFWLGEAERRSGDHAAAARSWRRALELQPESRDLKRALAMELVRAGEPDGRKLIEELLAEEPGDTELAAFLQPGPYPE